MKKWFIDEQKAACGNLRIYAEGGDKDQLVCLVENVGDKTEARANLIAAAPDLLKAAQNASNVLAALATGQLKTVSRNSAALKQLRATITKAKGESINTDTHDMQNKFIPDECRELTGLIFSAPDSGHWDFELTVNAEDYPIYAVAPKLLEVLERILYAHDMQGNGAAMGEATLCSAYASMVRQVIVEAKKGKP